MPGTKGVEDMEANSSDQNENLVDPSGFPPSWATCVSCKRAPKSPETVFLRCLHICCSEECVNKLREQSPSPYCPECYVTIDKNVVQPCSYLNGNIIEYVKGNEKSEEKALHEDQICKSCVLNARAHKWCKECQEFLCELCCEHHQYGKATVGHALVPASEGIVELSDKKETTVPDQKCQLHSEEDLMSFCVDCESALCSQCVSCHAPGHNFKSLQDFAAQFKSKYLSGIDNIELTQEKCLVAAWALEKKLQVVLTDQKSHLQTEAQASFKRLLDTLLQREIQFREDLVETTVAKAKELNIKKAKTLSIARQCKQYLATVKDIFEKGTVWNVLQHKQYIENQVKILDAMFQAISDDEKFDTYIEKNYSFCIDPKPVEMAEKFSYKISLPGIQMICQVRYRDSSKPEIRPEPTANVKTSVVVQNVPMEVDGNDEDEEAVDSEAETLDSDTVRAETDDFDDENPGPISPISVEEAVPPAGEIDKAEENDSSTASSETSDDSDKTAMIQNATELVQDYSQQSSGSSAIAASVQPAVDDPSYQPVAKSTYSIDKSIKCPKCSKNFKNLRGLNVHTRVIHGKKSARSMKIKCTVCRKVFINTISLYLHSLAHRKSKKASPRGAGAQGRSSGTFEVKSMETEGVEQAETSDSQENSSGSDTWFYQAKFGDGRPTTAMKRAALARQLTSKRLRAEKYKCDHCDLEFISPTSLMVHRRSHKFNCKYCVESFDTLEQAEDHKRLHMFDKTLLCPYCPKTFAYPSPLAKHVAKNHPDELTVSAEPGPSTRSPAAASQSIAHSSPTPRPIQRMSRRTSNSQVAPKPPKIKLAVKCSMRKPRMKNLPKDVTCCFCGKIFKTRQRLRAHESVHMGNRQFKCKYCPLDFFHESDLKVHEGAHEGGGQLFTCTLCKAGFMKKWILVSHMKSKHALDEDKAKISASLKATAAAAPTAGNVTLRVRPPLKVVEDDKEKSITQISVDGLVQYECNLCSGRFSHKTDILAHIHDDHGL